MKIVRVGLLVIGVLAIVLGIHWIGQGTGYFPWPRNPAIDDQMVWTYRGIGTALAGIVAVIVSRRT
jgi:uncharacterized membrane protein